MSTRHLPPARLASLCFAALLAACAAPVPKHVAATAGPSAQLIMRGSVQPGETYGVYLFQEPQNCGGLEQVGIGTTNVNPATTTIAANRLSTAEVLLTKPNRTVCRVRWSFDTVPGRKYLVASGSTPTGCTARILDATDPRNIVAEPSSRRRDVGGKLCIPMAQTMSLVDAAARARAESESDLPIVAAPLPSKPALKPKVTEDDLGGLIGK
jgi:hypothetical protein